MSYRELLRGKEETLLRIIHPNVLLLALLTEQDLLDECTEQAIIAERTNFDRNRRLLEWLKQSPREAFDGFLRALRTNGQEHVANYIDGTPGNRQKREGIIMQGWARGQHVSGGSVSVFEVGIGFSLFISIF